MELDEPCHRFGTFSCSGVHMMYVIRLSCHVDIDMMLNRVSLPEFLPLYALCCVGGYEIRHVSFELDTSLCITIVRITKLRCCIVLLCLYDNIGMVMVCYHCMD